ncbi:MAG: energy transducer TonB [Fibrobacterota bacterium]
MEHIPAGFHLPKKEKSCDPFPGIVLFLFAVGGFLALYLAGVPLPQRVFAPQNEEVEFFYAPEFSFEEEEEEPEPIPEIEEKFQEIPEEAPPVPDASTVRVSEEPDVHEPRDTPREETEKEPPRRVFGVERVYSSGLGSGGSAEDGVVGRRGNTLNRAYDTVSAEDSDLRGTLVSTAALTRAPSFKTRVIPTPTEEMKKEGVEGVISVRVLVDADGSVRKAIPQDDLGFGSREAALKAVLQMEFEPALRNDEAVAVWITIPIRFQLLHS